MRRSDRQQAYDQLLAVIRGVRRRWRLRMLLRGLAVTGVAAVLAVLAAGAVLGWLELSPAATAWARGGTGAVIALVAGWALLRPLLRRVTDEQVALYLEEHEPKLEAAVLSSVGVGAVSDALLARTVETAIRRCHEIGDGRWIERGALIRATASLAGVVVLAGMLGFFGPSSARRGAGLLFSGARPAEAATGAVVEVSPGDITVSRGADAAVSARLHGFEADLVELAVRAPGDSAFERLPMAAAADGSFGYLLFDLEQETEYFVEAAGVRSGVFTIGVADLPYVRRIDLELVFPAYTGLPPRSIEDGGDVAALRGTTVRVRATPTLPVPAGGIVVGEADPLPLVTDSAGALIGEFTVRADGFYRIVLEGPGGAAVEASPRYVIDALSDGPPIVAFDEPGRDERATAIDELYVEARAEDDYGVGVVTLHYSVNGGEERTSELYGGRPLAEVSAGHTFYLEEYGLQPGDLVSYYATASDNDAVDGRKQATSDLYFIQIRPFQRDYRAAESAPPPQGAQPGGGADGDLSERQRQIIAGTFNLVRDSADYPAAEYRENLNTLALAQERLRDQVRTLTQRMVARQVTDDSAFRRIAEILPRAAEEMEGAAERLRARDARGAVPPEQRALLHLQRAEAVFREVQVSFGQQQGGGGGATPNAEDLADLFELEMDKLQDQYETVNRGGAAADSASAQLDETMERLEELARRQQREAERRRREALQGRGTAGGESQRQLAEAAEEEARRLERLSRERRSPELQDAARRLREAAESMRRSAAGAGSEQEAVERLRDARRLLERGRTEGMRAAAEDAHRRAAELAEQQESIRREAERLQQPRPEDDPERARRLDERKAEQMADVDSLQQDLRRLAEQAGREEPEAARRLREAAGAIDETRLRDKIDFSRQLARSADREEYVRRLEEQIGEDLNELRDRLRGIGGAFQGPDGQPAEETLERARDLARGLESMRERTRELRERASGNPTGPGGFNPRTARQYRDEARERLEDARGLAGQLREQGLDAEEMEDVLRGLEGLTGSGAYEDPESLARVQAALADQARRLEVFLRIRLAGEERARLFLSGAEPVPPEYAELVEAYYRSLSTENDGR